MARIDPAINAHRAGHAGPDEHGSLIIAVLISAAVHGALLLFPVQRLYGQKTPGLEKINAVLIIALRPQLDLPAAVLQKGEVQAEIPQPVTINTGDGQAAEVNTEIGPSDSVPLPESYIPASKLSRRPQVLVHVELENEAIRSERHGGIVRARLLINRQGTVDKVVIDDSNLPTIYDQAVVEGFLQARFRPGELEGSTVASELPIEIEYEYVPRAPTPVAPAEEQGSTPPG